MVRRPIEIIKYEKDAIKAKNRILNRKCKNCNRTFQEGGLSGTPGICAKCLRGE